MDKETVIYLTLFSCLLFLLSFSPYISKYLLISLSASSYLVHNWPLYLVLYISSYISLFLFFVVSTSVVYNLSENEIKGYSVYTCYYLNFTMIILGVSYFLTMLSVTIFITAK